jgi:Multicopper oxidase
MRKNHFASGSEAAAAAHCVVGRGRAVCLMSGRIDVCLIAVRCFGDYMLHCHVLQHEDRGMMARYVLVKRGDPFEAHHKA